MRYFIVKLHTTSGLLITELSEKEMDDIDEARTYDVSADWFEIVNEVYAGLCA